MDERTRIREGDCLAEWRCALEMAARGLRPWDADRWLPWVEACADLLAAVPHEDQRVSWAYALATPVCEGVVGMPPATVAGLLFARGEAVRAAGGVNR